MIDNSGVPHGRDDWFKLASDMDGGGHYWAYVGTGRDADGALYTTGMHCLGFRDAELVNPSVDEDRAYFILHNFLGYSYRSGAVIEDGHIMGDEVAGVAMQVKAIPCTRPGRRFAVLQPLRRMATRARRYNQRPSKQLNWRYFFSSMGVPPMS